MKPQPVGFFKCNTDGGWSEEARNSSMGCVLKDSHGEVKWMGGRAIPRVWSAMETEAVALRWAVTQSWI